MVEDSDPAAPTDGGDDRAGTLAAVPTAPGAVIAATAHPERAADPSAVALHDVAAVGDAAAVGATGSLEDLRALVGALRAVAEDADRPPSGADLAERAASIATERPGLGPCLVAGGDGLYRAADGAVEPLEEPHATGARATAVREALHEADVAGGDPETAASRVRTALSDRPIDPLDDRWEYVLATVSGEELTMEDGPLGR